MSGIRAAKIQDGVVVYFTTPEDGVIEFNDYLIDPKDAVLGSRWDGIKFLAPALVPPTIQEYTDAVQGHLDAVAQAHGYDSILSACSYAAAPNTFQAEGAKFISWRGAVWDTCHALMAQVQAGTLAQPTVAALLTMLPTIPS